MMTLEIAVCKELPHLRITAWENGAQKGSYYLYCARGVATSSLYSSAPGRGIPRALINRAMMELQCMADETNSPWQHRVQIVTRSAQERLVPIFEGYGFVPGNRWGEFSKEYVPGGASHE